jgi:hypothetical protein
LLVFLQGFDVQLAAAFLVAVFFAAAFFFVAAIFVHEKVNKLL